MTAVEQVVHESEAQRQHVRVNMPAKALINNKSYLVKDLSSGGMSIQNIDGEYARGQVFSLTLILPFGDFALDVHLKVQVRSFDVQEKMLGTSFVDLNHGQISLINHIVKAFIVGDVVSSGDLLQAVGRDNFVKTRKPQAISSESKGKTSAFRQAFPLLIIASIGLGAVALIASNVYKGVFVLATNNAIVEADAVTVRSTDSGIFRTAPAASAASVAHDAQIGAIVMKSAPVMASAPVPVIAADGTVLPTPAPAEAEKIALLSPCDCYIEKKLAQDGEYVQVGAPIYKLIPMDATPWISVSVNPNDAQRLKMDDKVTLKIVGEDVQTTGRISNIEMHPGIGLDTSGNPMALTTVQVTPDQQLPANLVGRPVMVQFQTF